VLAIEEVEMTTNGDTVGKYVRQLRRQHGFGIRQLQSLA
jgi:hypothetical protein